MYDRILYPTDGSEPAESALEYAIRIASEHGATMHVLNVADTNRDSLAQIRTEVVDVLVREGEGIVDEAAERVSERGVSVVSDVLQGAPSASIVEYGTEEGVDLIVMPTHGRRGLKRYLIGSVTERVINTADVPVIAVNPDPDRTVPYPCRDLLVPTDGSPGADRALREGIAVAKATGATLHLLHVVEEGSLGPAVRSISNEDPRTEKANRIITEATEAVAAAPLDAIESEIVHGSPAREIRTYINEHGIDLAILGIHGESDFSRYMMGGVSAKVVRTSPIPIMWVREPASDE